MAVKTTNIRCNDCGVFTQNSDNCKQCGKVISYKKQQELKRQQQESQRIAIEKHKIDNPGFVERMKKHPFVLYRLIGWLLYSTFLVISAIGAGLAWFIAMVAAG